MRVVFALLFIVSQVFAAEIKIDAAKNRKPISPLIYGRNNSLSDYPGSPITQQKWQFFKDAGIQFFRECGGNNSTKYNWRKKLSSHPDWYNNVYDHDWDYSMESLADNHATAIGMWGFQLIGMVAANKNNNFNDWGYNQSQWWDGVHNNWAGGGGPNSGDGDPDLYLMDWPADSTVGILQHWLDTGIDPAVFQYWSMDNEPEIWNGTHDDIVPDSMTAEEFLAKYFAVAKKARAIYPEIKLLGPVPANEWQWYNWNNDKISYNGKSYTWLEYFILRVAEEQQASGVRLLDVLDIHFYPGESNASDIVQLHRVWFDRTYKYPGANGVKRAGSGGWTDSIREEYVFGRCQDWLEKYMGADHGVKLGVSEIGVQGSDANVTASWYVSMLGTFANEGVEFFTPWDWKVGQWEVVHLMSRYNEAISISSVSDNEETVSAYSSINETGSAMTIVLVNRNLTGSETAAVSLSNFNAPNGQYTSRSLQNLPSGETFKSHSDNALVENAVTVENNSLSISLPALSVTSIQLTGQAVTSVVENVPESMDFAVEIYPNPFNPETMISYTLHNSADVNISIFDINGRMVQSIELGKQAIGTHNFKLNGSHLSSGVYFAQLKAGAQIVRKKITLFK